MHCEVDHILAVFATHITSEGLVEAMMSHVDPIHKLPRFALEVNVAVVASEDRLFRFWPDLLLSVFA